MKRLGLFLFIMALCLALPMMVYGQSSTTFGVTTNIPEICSVAATNMNFGPYTGADLTATSSISVACLWMTSYEITLDAGLNYDGISRRMATVEPVYYLRYYLYQNPWFGTQWGDSTRANTYPWGPGLWGSGDAAYTVYGWLPGGQTGITGTYSDTVTVTVYW